MKKLYTKLSTAFLLCLLFNFNLSAQVPEIFSGNQYSSSVVNDTNIYEAYFVSTEASFITLSTYNSENTDTRIVVRDNDGNIIASADDNALKYAIIDDRAITADTFHVVVENKESETDHDIILYFEMVSATNYNANLQSNDDVCSAMALNLDSAYQDLTNMYSTKEASITINQFADTLLAGDHWSELSSFNSVWYQFTAPQSGTIEMEFEPNFSMQWLLVRADNCSDDLTFVDAGEIDSQLKSIYKFCAEPGANYYLLIDGVAVSQGELDLEIWDINFQRDFTVLVDVTDTNTLSGVLGAENICPASEYSVVATIVKAADSSAIMPEYAQTLTATWALANETTNMGDMSMVDLEEGEHTVVFEDKCGNQFSASLSLVDTVPTPIDIILNEVTVADCQAGIGSVDVEVVGGILPVGGYKLFLNDGPVDAAYSTIGNYATSYPVSMASLDMLSVGTYKLYAEDGCGIYDSLSFRIENPNYSDVIAEVASTENPNCPNTNTGSIAIDGNGGQNAGLTYEWYFDANNDTTNLWAAGLVAEDSSVYLNAPEGLYAVIVADACVDSAANNRDTLLITLTDPEFDTLIFDYTSSVPSTYDAKDGSFALNISGGSGLLEIAYWFNGEKVTAFDDESSIDTLTQGHYMVSVEDECLNRDTTFEFNLVAALANDNACDAILISEGDSVLYSNEGSTLEAGEDTLTLPISTGNGWSAENMVQSSVWFKFIAPTSGKVQLDVTTHQFPFVNNNFDPQVAIFSGDCSNISSLSLMAANDNYTVTNDARVIAECLEPGEEYLVLVDGTNGLGQEGLFYIDIKELSVPAFTSDAEITQTIDCNTPTGIISLNSVSGGIPFAGGDYSVVFNGTEFDDYVGDTIVYTGLNAGVYTLDIYDECGLQKTYSFELEGFDNDPLTVEFDVTAPTCVGGADAIVDFAFEGGATNSYNIQIDEMTSNGTFIQNIVPNTPVNGDEYTINTLYQGYFLVTFSDDCGNEKEFVVEIVDPVNTDLSIVETIDSPDCNNVNDGVYTGVIEGGSRGDKTFWFADNMVYANATNVQVMGNTQDTIEISGLAPGTYYLRVEDFCAPTNDTDIWSEITIVDPNLAAITISDSVSHATTIGGTDGSFVIEISGGLQPYDTLLTEYNNGVVGDTLALVDGIASNLAAGTYRVSVDDVCDQGTVVKQVVVLEPNANNLACGAIALNSGEAKTGENLAATLTAVDATVPVPTLSDITPEADTWYKDGMTAPVWYTFEVPASGSVNVSASSTDFDVQLAVYTTTDCNDGASFTLLKASDDVDGSENASLDLVCRTPGEMLYILVDVNAQLSNDRGSFNVTATDNSLLPLTVYANVVSPTNENTADGEIDVLIVGGNGEMTFEWFDNGVASAVDTEDRTGLMAGIYRVIVTDECGYTAAKTIYVDIAGRSNDLPCKAQEIIASGMPVQFSNVAATADENEPMPDSTYWSSKDSLDATVWFKFVAPAGGEVSIELCSNAPDAMVPQIAVYSVQQCASYATYTLIDASEVNVDCNANGAKLDLSGLDACRSYYIQVDSKDGSGINEITLTDLGFSLSAGEDVAEEYCTDNGVVDLADLLVNADTGGVFVDEAGNEVSSEIDPATLGVGEYTYNYIVGVKCNGEYISADMAELVITVVNCDNVQEIDAAAISLYPNPATDVLNVEGIRNVKIIVSDINGKQVLSEVLRNGTIDISTLALGVYTIDINGAKKRFVKQ